MTPSSSERIGKYLVAVAEPARGKTSRWRVEALDGALLGRVAWYGPWRQYTFDPEILTTLNPEILTTFNAGCLTDIASFLARENTRHREPSCPPPPSLFGPS